MDIASSLGGNIHDDAVSAIVAKKLHSVDDPRHETLTDEQKATIKEYSTEVYSSLVLIQHACKRIF